jgi:hypothetical protein
MGGQIVREVAKETAKSYAVSAVKEAGPSILERIFVPSQTALELIEASYGDIGPD